MNQSKDFRYMSIIEMINDVNNTFLSRRELTCSFTGLGGKLKKLEAIDMITKEFKLDGKVVIPIIMKNEMGKNTTSGTFYVYDDENLAKKHINPTIFARLERSKKKLEEASTEKESTEDKTESEGETKAEEPSEEKKEESTEDKKVKAEDSTDEKKDEEKSE